MKKFLVILLVVTGVAWGVEDRQTLKGGTNIEGLLYFNHSDMDYVIAAEANTFTIPADHTLYRISSDDPVTSDATTAVATPSRANQIMLLVNNGSQNITIKDEANTDLGADAVLGPNDILLLIWNGVDWLKGFLQDNS